MIKICFVQNSKLDKINFSVFGNDIKIPKLESGVKITMIKI